jgi:hypothetical protein
MFKKRTLSRNDFILIAANLVPVFGVWFEGWSPIEAFVVYALETIIIGAMTLLKLLVLTLTKGKDDWYNGGQKTRVSGFLFMFFFAVHYGLFVAVQTSLFSESAGIVPSGKGPLFFFFHWYEFVNANVAIMLGAFVVSYLATSFIPFLVRGKFKNVSMTMVMFQPYGRIFIQQCTVIIGSMFLTLGAGKAFILIFALIKSYFDVYLNFDHLIEKSVAEVENKISTKKD